MPYVQNKVNRLCRICDKPIGLDERMMDLFRRPFGGAEQKRECCWAHESCGRTVLEKYLEKKWEREEKEKGNVAK